MKYNNRKVKNMFMQLKSLTKQLYKPTNDKYMMSYSRASVQKEFTIEELAKYNGIDGKPSYVAVDGIVYDVSNETSWKAGIHFGLSAGQDLTESFNNCHNKAEILDQLPKVGILKE